MKLSKTGLRELSKKYRIVLIKCLLLNMVFFSTPVGAEISIPNIEFKDNQETIQIPSEFPDDDFTNYKLSSISVRGKDTSLTLQGDFAGWTRRYNEEGEAQGWSGNGKSLIAGDTVSVTGGATLELKNLRLELIEDGEGASANSITVTGSKVVLRNSSLDGSSDDELDGFNTVFDNAHFEIIDSEMPIDGAVEFKNGSILSYSCLNCGRLQEKFGPTDSSTPTVVYPSTNDYQMITTNLIIDGSQIVLGDKNREVATNTDDASLETRGNLVVKKSKVTLNAHSSLAFNGIVHEADEEDKTTEDKIKPFKVEIIDSFVTLNHDSKIQIGVEDEDATKDATLNINNSVIELNGNSKIMFDASNTKETTITNSQIKMTGSSSMLLNDVVLETTEGATQKTALIMKGESTVIANDVTITDAVIDMTGNSFLDVWDVKMDGVETTGNASIRIRKNDVQTQSEDDNSKNDNSIALTLKGMNISTNIISDNANNKVQFLGDVKFSGLFDPATAEVGNSTDIAKLVRSGYDDEITYNINNGTLSYEKDIYLYDASKHTHSIGETREENNAFADGKYALNSLNFNGGDLDIRNGSASDIKLAHLTVSQESNLYLDADLANKKIDTLTADTITVNAKLNIAGLNLISDATQEETVVNFTSDEKLLANVDYTGKTSGLKALSPLYSYDVSYDTANGDFTFKRVEAYNPTVYASTSSAQTVGFLQQNIANVVFDKITVPQPVSSGRSGGDEPKLQNIWATVIGFDDNVEFDSFNTIDSEMFSVVTGMNSVEKETSLGNAVFGAYAGYLNGEQKYTGNEIKQEGGYIGLTSALTKGNVSLLSMLNTGFIRNESEHSFGTDKYNTYWGGVSAKIGYNYHVSEDITVQPFVYGGYTLVKSEDYTSKSGLRIKSDNLHVFEFAPGIRVDKSFCNGWNGFVQAKYAFVKDKGGDVTVDAVSLPNISTKDYAEYGLGIEKELSDNWNVSASLNRRDGGRQGWNGSIEFKYNF